MSWLFSAPLGLCVTRGRSFRRVPEQGHPLAGPWESSTCLRKSLGSSFGLALDTCPAPTCSWVLPRGDTEPWGGQEGVKGPGGQRARVRGGATHLQGCRPSEGLQGLQGLPGLSRHGLWLLGDRLQDRGGR